MPWRALSLRPARLAVSRLTGASRKPCATARSSSLSLAPSIRRCSALASAGEITPSAQATAAHTRITLRNWLSMALLQLYVQPDPVLDDAGDRGAQLVAPGGAPAGV